MIMKKPYRRNGKNKSGNRFQGNANAFYDEIAFRHKKLLKGLPLTKANIIDYRDAIKSISAQVLYKGISGLRGSNLKSMNFDTIFSSIIDKDSFDEISSFYACFNDLFYNRVPRRFKANLSQYQAKGKDSITHAILDIQYVIKYYLYPAYEKLSADYERFEIDKPEFYDAINKLKVCANALEKICDINIFLYKRIIPKTISNRDYTQVYEDGCNIENYYSKKDGKWTRQKNVCYAELGCNGAMFFVKKTFRIKRGEKQ